MNPPLLYSACWPNIRYAGYIFTEPLVLVEQYDTYARQTYRNRYEILSANGVLPLTVPVRYRGNRSPMNEIMISYSERWQTRHWRALTSAYRKSAFFEFFEDELRVFYFERTERLLDYNLRQIQWLMTVLKYGGEIRLTAEYEKVPAGRRDLRHLADPRDAHADIHSARRYFQTFGDRFGFIGNLSVLDLVFNLGLGAKEHLEQKSG